MRPARAVIDLSALLHNYRLARSLSGCAALAVVKADAYGHGAVRCAQALAAEADGMAVACIEEALELREAGIRQPILLLEGFFHADELELCAEHDLWPVIHAAWQLDALEQARLSKPLDCWLKLDSGMHRVGFFPHDYAAAWRRLRACANVADIVMVTHLARADEPGSTATLDQLQQFNDATRGLTGLRSLSNSAAVMAWPEMASDWTRPGIMLYGSNPLPGEHAMGGQLRPVMTLESRVIAVRELPAGEAVGYGARFIAQKPTRIGVVAMGYADGYPRHAVDGTPVRVDGQLACLAGRVSMDMLTVDLSALPHAGVGSRVELWGNTLPVELVARHADTIAYTLLSGVRRVARSYHF